MLNQNCIFCKIIINQIPCQKIKETSDLIVIKDISPRAPIHYLIIPKKHIQDLRSTTDADNNLLCSILLMAKSLSNEIALPNDFRIISNNGSSVGQSVMHIHFHFLAGTYLSE